MLALLAADDAALDANRDVTGNGAEVIDFHLPRHGRIAQGAHCFAHGLVEQRGDDAAMQVAGMALESIGDGGKAHDGAVGSEQELEVQPGGIGRAAAEAAVLAEWAKGLRFSFERTFIELEYLLCGAALTEKQDQDRRSTGIM